MLSHFVIPRVSKFLVDRAEAIDGKLREASLLRQEAEVLLNDYESILTDAKIEARHRYMEVASRVAKDITKQQKDMMEQINERIRMAEQDIFRVRGDVLKELHPKTLDVAADILKKITGQKYTKAELKNYQEKA